MGQEFRRVQQDSFSAPCSINLGRSVVVSWQMSPLEVRHDSIHMCRALEGLSRTADQSMFMWLLWLGSLRVVYFLHGGSKKMERVLRDSGSCCKASYVPTSEVLKCHWSSKSLRPAVGEIARICSQH